MKKSVILLEGTTKSSSESQRSGSMDYSYATPGGLLFAVYFTPGGPGLFTSCTSQDYFASPYAVRGAMETGVLSFSGNIGLEVCWLEQAWATAVESAKATGVVLLLGVGGLLFYKFLYSQPRVKLIDGIRAFLFESIPFVFELGQEDEDDAEDEEEEEEEELTEKEEEDLFDLFEVDLSVGLNCLSGEHRPKRKIGKGVYIADQIRTRWRHVNQRSPALTSQFRPLPLRRHYSSPEELVRLQQHKYAQEESSYLVHLSEEGDAFSSVYTSPSQESSPNRRSRHRSHSLSFRDPRYHVETLWSRWDGSVESFVSGMDVSEVSRLIRDCSIDSDGSDFSLDMSLNEGCGLTTLQVIERIEAEINSVKNNCLEMNHEIFTLHSDASQAASPIPHSASGLELVALHANRASFKGLLNLTAIQDELSDGSSVSGSPVHLRLSCISSSEEDPFSLEWDNEDLLIPVHTKMEASGLTLPLSELCLLPADSPAQVAIPTNMLEVQNNPVWCSQESGYLEWEGTPTDSASVSNLSPLLEKRENDSMSCTTSYSSCLTTPDDASASSSSSVFESGVRRRQWAEASHRSNRDSAIFDLGVDLEAAWREESVGTPVQLSCFANDTWQAPTPRAHTIKQAYMEMERMTNCRRMRRIRGDQYGILRAALCQMVSKRLAFPPSKEAIDCIVRDMKQGSYWIQDWTFGHRLPYGPDNTVQGIYECFDALDHLMGELMGESDPLECLVARLNADVMLDTRLMEAIKLHVLSAALSLELADALGDALPLFALALFSRDNSKTAKDLALNYLNPIGDSTTLEKAEYYLLGYALGVRLDVYRPTAISLDKEDNMDLLTSYPDWESFSDFISIIEEDDRHYSIPVP